MGLDAPAPKFDLLVEVEERTEGLAGRFVFHRGLFEPETIERMAGHWQLVLEQMVAGPERPVTELELLTEPERTQLLEQWSAGGAGAGRAGRRGADRSAGPEEPRRDGGGVRVRAAEFRRPGHAGRPAGPVPAGARGGPRRGRGRVPGALARAGDRAAGHLPGRGCVRTAGPGGPPGADPLRGGGHRHAAHADSAPAPGAGGPDRDASGVPGRGQAEAEAAVLAGPRNSPRRSAGRTSRRTSSTPRVRPGSPRASWSSAGRCRPTAGRSSRSGVWARRTGSRSSASTASTPRWSRSCPRWPPEPSWSCGAMRSGRRASCSMSCRRIR